MHSPGSRLAAGLAGVLCLIASAPAWAFTVFACEPEWAALTRTLLPQAQVHVATHAGQDPHHIEARPALIAQLRGADLAVCTGAGLESGWLPMLQQRAANAPTQDVFFAADQVALIDPQPGAIGSPWAGDVHAEGNPHLHTDPAKLLEVAQALAERLQKALPSEKNAIEQRRAQFEREWKARMAGWAARAAPLKGQRVVAQHSTFGYLWRWLGITQVADLEPRPGMAPTPGHLQRLLEGLRAQPPMAVVVASYQDSRPARWITTQLNSSAPGQRVATVPLLTLPSTVSETAAAAELARWMDALLDSLLAARQP
jgi:zinc/manganese transport system substrate-binding protein